MTTIAEMAGFLAGCPSDASVVLVVRRGKAQVVMSSPSVAEAVESNTQARQAGRLPSARWPDWPVAVFEGLAAAIEGRELDTDVTSHREPGETNGAPAVGEG